MDARGFMSQFFHFLASLPFVGLLWWLRHLRICLQCRRPRINPWVRKIPWKRKWQSTPMFLEEPGGLQSIGSQELDTIEWLTRTHTFCTLTFPSHSFPIPVKLKCHVAIESMDATLLERQYFIQLWVNLKKIKAVFHWFLYFLPCFTL